VRSIGSILITVQVSLVRPASSVKQKNGIPVCFAIGCSFSFSYPPIRAVYTQYWLCCSLTLACTVGETVSSPRSLLDKSVELSKLGSVGSPSVLVSLWTLLEKSSSYRRLAVA